MMGKTTIILVLCCLSKSSLQLQELLTDDVLLKQSNDAIVFKLNKAIDFLLTVARWMFTSHGQLVLKLPDIDRELGGKYNGTFTASGGTFTNIGSLHRTGDIAFIKANSSLALEVALGLSELRAGYKNYTLKILKIHQSGDMKLTVNRNSLKMKMSFTYSPDCKFDLDELAFDILSGVKVDITGLGVFQLLYDEISKWLISNFEERFRTIANKDMHKKLRKQVNKNTEFICKFWPHL